MADIYGRLLDTFGGYEITKLPKVGNREYIYNSKDIQLRVDQFGVSLAMVTPPGGIGLFKREKREMVSPIRVMFEYEEKTYNSFDVFKADKLKITYLPEKAIYELNFGKITVKTTLFIISEGSRIVSTTEFTNDSDKDISLKVLPICTPYMSPLSMAPWDKPEWYTSIKYLNNYFVATHFSVEAKVEDRRFMSIVSDLPIESKELSYERLLDSTNNFESIPESLSSSTEDILYGFDQVASSLSIVSIRKHSGYSFTQVYTVSSKESDITSDVETAKELFKEEKREEELLRLKAKFDKLFSVQKVKTPDEDFNRFVNGFLPLQMDWVSMLDRGWATGMRGVRDAANDYLAFINYDKAATKNIITNIFSKQRSDGWYPRQVPFGDSTKFDLRHFVDSACFFSELVYEYVCNTNDYSILEDEYPYYDSDLVESGLTHYLKGIEYLMQPENIGEHGLIKLQGGDWLDCLAGIGAKGKAETVMVSAQIILAIEQMLDLLDGYKDIDKAKYQTFAAKMKESINKNAFNELGYYNAIYSDDGDWFFSPKDRDDEKRVYVPTNAYALISGVASKEQVESVVRNIEDLKTEYGYRLFTTPLGVKPVKGIGKLGTGDFQAGFAENASVYNHGAQCFYIRALHAVSDYDRIGEVLKCAIPIYHDGESSCNAPYAITNCYHILPSFKGRTMFSFLTGSIAMIIRSIYNWIFGVNYTSKYLEITPCIPKEYKDSEVVINGEKTLNIKYIGYGSKIKSFTLNGEENQSSEVKIDKSKLLDNNTIIVELC